MCGRRSALGSWPQVNTLPSVPDLSSGEVAVRGGEHVHATDGNIGEIQGLVIDSGSHQVTHVLLEEGHGSAARSWRSRSAP